ncbi:glycosyltransferase family 4 protein [Empedobacter stercoris]|uniref:Glycosyltransferase family 4 protein n=1 Tax=Empedobacter falsenii TaxID=343874 RepID=A0ABY8V4F4_9FLAO|nr:MULTISPECIES: glycosyltransferase family 4 protein [Empedobacter]UWX66017.1 glycosyltransferase family 4 protein [Empedobacter stercoris]WIH96242.1 glycosyltransferase family 4 protein [Empedobacter falsenii]
MNILFLTLVGINSIEDRGIYQDLLRKFRNEGHQLTIVTPVERRKRIPTNFSSKEGINILQVKTFNITKKNVIEKGIGTLAIEYQYLQAVKKYLKNIKFDLILYSTPPITLVKVIEFIKKRDNAYSYLLLKDIFPQNAIDMKMMKPDGFLHRYFVKKEKELYKVSDKIGCMSPANVDFIVKHNPEINPEKVEVNPNSIDPIEIKYTVEEKIEVRSKYDLPLDKKILVYGGNLGKPQGLDFLIETIKACKNSNAYFLIVGDGTEFPKLKEWFDVNKPNNAKLLQRLPKEDYVKMLAACDIGLIFLHKDFLIPNFPSRLLSYLEMKKPIIAATDSNTDIGDIIEQNNCGKKVIAGDIEQMLNVINELLEEDLKKYEQNCINLLNNEYLVERSYQIIISHFNHLS